MICNKNVLCALFNISMISSDVVELNFGTIEVMRSATKQFQMNCSLVSHIT